MHVNYNNLVYRKVGKFSLNRPVVQVALETVTSPRCTHLRYMQKLVKREQTMIKLTVLTLCHNFQVKRVEFEI